MADGGRDRGPEWLPRLAGVAMLVFGLLQLNDPDPLIWVSYYVAVAIACTLAAYRPLPAVVLVVLGGVTVGGILLTLPGFADWLLNRPTSDLWAPMATDRMYIEHSRELLGMVIAGACLAVAFRWSRR